MKNKFYNIIPILLLLISNYHTQAQCTASVVQASLTSNITPSFAIKNAQSFTPNCSGQLTSITFTFSRFADDFRATGDFIRCNLKTSAGTIITKAIWPNGKDTTDNVYPSTTTSYTTLTANFECSNVSLISGTQYIWEVEDTTSDLISFPSGHQPVLLFEPSATNVYAGGNIILDGTPTVAKDFLGWTVNISNGSIASANATKAQIITPCTAFYNATPQLIANVQPGTTNGIAGNTTAKVWLETSQPAQFVKRHYEITPAANAATATGIVTLYFTQSEFDAFNAVNALKLPTGPADVTGKANLSIEKRPGISSDGSGLPGTYTGAAVSIDPADANIVWNSALNRWEVSFAVTGFSGFFVKTTTGTLPIKWLSIAGNINNQKQVLLKWQVQENNIVNYTIEKSTDSRLFNSTITISSKGDGINDYSFTDVSPLNGTGYYRIKQMDKDGRLSYSSIIKLSGQLNSNLSVYPVVFVNGFTVNSARPQTAVLVDAQGKQVKTIQLSSGSNYIDAAWLGKGFYILKTQAESGFKIIKE